MARKTTVVAAAFLLNRHQSTKCGSRRNGGGGGGNGNGNSDGKGNGDGDGDGNGNSDGNGDGDSDCENILHGYLYGGD